jgi:hypothetical protein
VACGDGSGATVALGVLAGSLAGTHAPKATTSSRNGMQRITYPPHSKNAGQVRTVRSPVKDMRGGL